MYIKFQWKHKKEAISAWWAVEFPADSKGYYHREDLTGLWLLNFIMKQMKHHA